MMNIKFRRLIEVSTDYQKRCYDGCHFSSEHHWTSWGVLEVNTPVEKIELRLKFWRDLNDYAVRERGENAKCEYEAVREVL